MEALDILRRGRAAAHSRGDFQLEARLANRAALIHREMLNLSEARVLFKRALALTAQSGDIAIQAQAHFGLGLVAHHLGRLQEALSEYRTAQHLWHQVGNPGEEARSFTSLGHILLMAGQDQDALASFGQALPLLDLADQRRVRFDTLDGAGLAFHDLGARQKAIWAYGLALKLATKPAEEAQIRHRLGIVYRDEGNLGRAWQELDRARGLAHAQGDSRWEAFTLADLAHIEDLRGRDEQALLMFDKAFRMLEPFPEPIPKASMLFGRAEALLDMGRLDEGIASVAHSLDLVEPVRADLADPALRINFFSWRQRYYELYVTLLMNRYRRDRTAGWHVKAFEASDLSQSRSLVDDLAGEPTTRGSTLDEIQHGLLDADTTLLAYTLGDRGSFLWVVTSDGITAFDLPVRRQIEEAVARARTRLPLSGSGPEIETLSRMLLPNGIEPWLRGRLVVRPDGALHAIPFSSLLNSAGRPLILNHVVSSLPSASFLVGMRRRLASRPVAQRQLAVLADAVFERDDIRVVRAAGPALQSPKTKTVRFDRYLNRLALSRKEADEISQLFPSTGRLKALDFEANRRTATSPALAQSQIIHITTHHIEGDHPDFGGLMLSRYDERGLPQEGLLRASEIYKLRLQSELVVLSACGSGLSPRIRGEGPMGMTRAFLHAGAKRTVVSLWDVEDDATTELMTRFYRTMLQQKLPPSEALRSAQLSMASDQRWRSSRAWAAFVLQGEPR